MALNIIDISFQTCKNAQLDAEAGLPKPKTNEGMVLLVLDDPQAVYVWDEQDRVWVEWTL